MGLADLSWEEFPGCPQCPRVAVRAKRSSLIREEGHLVAVGYFRGRKSVRKDRKKSRVKR